MKKYLAEFIGTFALVFCGTGAVVVNQESEGSLGLIGIAVAFGMVVVAMIYVFGPISGAHINPAVTISLAIGKLMPKKEVLGYLIAQFLGAFLGSLLLGILFPTNPTLGITVPNGSDWQSFSIELMLTFFLMLTILGASSKKEFSNVAGIVIGLVLIGIILFAGPISGGSFNPARTLAPALVAGNFTSVWIYMTAPIMGAIMAMLIWKAFNNEKAEA